jgi:hypothetical protein
MVFSGFITLGGFAPGGHRVVALRSPFAAAVWVIDWIFGNTARRRTKAKPANSTRFTPRNIFLIGIPDLADGGATIRQDVAQFAGR